MYGRDDLILLGVEGSDPVILRPNFRVLFRRARALVVLQVVVIAVIAVGMVYAAENASPRLAHQLGAGVLLFVAYFVAVFMLMRPALLRAGVYARPGEAGILGLDGLPHRSLHPVTHFVRVTTVNQIGIGSMRSVPVVYGINDFGQRLIALHSWTNETGEIDALIAVSAIPVETLDQVGIMSLNKRFPMAPEVVAQQRRNLLVAGPLVLLLIVGLVLLTLAVH